jgi:hypothetical protein
MVQGFYELLGVEPSASAAELRAAYQRRLGDLVRRLRQARKQGADTSLLEAQERDLRVAIDVLSDPARRRRYDAFRSALVRGLPEDAGALWEQARGSLVDPAAALAVGVMRALTTLPVGDPLPDVVPAGRRRRVPPPPAPAPALAPAPAPAPAPALAPAIAAPAPQLPPLPPVPAPAPVIEIEEIPSVSAYSVPPGMPSLADLDAELDRLPVPPPAIRLAPPAAPAPVEPPGDPVERLARRHGFDGTFLREVRRLRGLEVDDLARSTRINARFLTAIEDNAFDRLPAATFVRGYVKQMADVLGLGDRGVVEGYMALYAQHRG